MKLWLSALCIVLGSGLAAHGLSGFWQYGWPANAQLQIAVGVGMLTLGVVARKESN
jgi:hypothetical protein